MASKPSHEPVKSPSWWIALPGQLIGFFVASILLSITLEEVFGGGVDWGFPLTFIGWFVGGTIGGLIQLRRQDRSAENSKLMRQQLSLFAVLAPMFLVAWLGERFYGPVGKWGGLFGIAGLIMLMGWLVRRSSQGAKDPNNSGSP